VYSFWKKKKKNRSFQKFNRKMIITKKTRKKVSFIDVVGLFRKKKKIN